MRGRVRTRAFFARGGRDMTEGSTGSTPRDCAGGPSIRISILLRQWMIGWKCLGYERLTDPENLHGIERVLEAENCAE